MEPCLVLFDEDRDSRSIGRVNVQKLNADPCTLKIATENRSTADRAQSGQIELQAQRPANGIVMIQFKEGSAGTEIHEAPTGAHLASGAIDPHVNVQADLRAWVSPLIGWRVDHDAAVSGSRTVQLNSLSDFDQCASCARPVGAFTGSAGVSDGERRVDMLVDAVQPSGTAAWWYPTSSRCARRPHSGHLSRRQGPVVPPPPASGSVSAGASFRPPRIIRQEPSQQCRQPLRFPPPLGQRATGWTAESLRRPPGREQGAAALARNARCQRTYACYGTFLVREGLRDRLGQSGLFRLPDPFALYSPAKSRLRRPGPRTSSGLPPPAQPLPPAGTGSGLPGPRTGLTGGQVDDDAELPTRGRLLGRAIASRMLPFSEDLPVNRPGPGWRRKAG